MGKINYNGWQRSHVIWSYPRNTCKLLLKKLFLTHMTLSGKSYVRLNKTLWHTGNVKYTFKCSLRYWMEKIKRLKTRRHEILLSFSNRSLKTDDNFHFTECGRAKLLQESRGCYVFVRVCLYVLCGHLLGKGWPLGFRLWCLLWVCHFPIGILGQVWYLNELIPDLCILTYFVNIILDNKALYVYKHKNESAQLFPKKKRYCFFRQKTNALHINRKLFKSTKHVEVSDL